MPPHHFTGTSASSARARMQWEVDGPFQPGNKADLRPKEVDLNIKKPILIQKVAGLVAGKCQPLGASQFDESNFSKSETKRKTTAWMCSRGCKWDITIVIAL